MLIEEYKQNALKMILKNLKNLIVSIIILNIVQEVNLKILVTKKCKSLCQRGSEQDEMIILIKVKVILSIEIMCRLTNI